VTALLLLAGCGGSDGSDDSPGSDPSGTGGTTAVAADRAVGAYDFTTVITRSTIDQNKAGKDSKETNVVYVSCWDEECDTLAQRAAADMWHAQTFRIVPDGDTYRSTRTRTGSCGADSDTSFEEVFTVEWTLGRDGSLSGRAVQEFTGCSGGGSDRAVYEVTGEKRRSGELPYLAEPAVGDVIAALNNYDQAFTTVSEEFAACLELATEDAASCRADIYRPWSSSMDELGDALDLVTSGATGACRAALEGAELDATARQVRAAAARLARVDDKRSASAAERVDEAARAQSTALQAQLVQVATMCVPPRASSSLGDDGVMLIDSASSLIPPLDG
jgi:hypothetical protein